MPREDLFALGSAIRAVRTQAGLTLQAIADHSGLSRGLLSKIENSRTMPSLSVLLRIAEALEMPLWELMRHLERDDHQNYILIRSDERTPVERENTNGFRYETILATGLKPGAFEAAVLHVSGNSNGELISTDGEMFVFCLHGCMHLQLEDERIPLNPGDAIFFDGRIPHLSQHEGKGSASVLVIYLLHEDKHP